jgi:hypothetical protein
VTLARPLRLLLPGHRLEHVSHSVSLPFRRGAALKVILAVVAGCTTPLTLEAGWHIHHLLWRTHGGGYDMGNLVLLHPNCHRQVHSEGLVVKKAASREGRS